MYIVVYNQRALQAIGDFMELTRLLDKKGIKFYKRKYFITVENDIAVDFRVGKIEKMVGLRPDYFVIADDCSWLVREFLMQSASKTNGKELESVYEVAKVIEKEVKS